jgi:hypothetical protein
MLDSRRSLWCRRKENRPPSLTFRDLSGILPQLEMEKAILEREHYTAEESDFHLKNPLEDYRRFTLMMLDTDVVAVSPASVWQVLKQAGLLAA